jgi:hypothetical protein
LAVYIPYSDWVIERWTTSFLPALDGFRLLGVAVDLVPWAPRHDESVLPYYPIHRNDRVLERLLDTRTVLVMPDVSGLQQTDSDLIAAFVERGGVLLLFGPQLPMGRTYDRLALIGAEELPAAKRRALVIDEAAGRASAGARLPIQGAWPAWQPTSARVLARFDGGGAAVFEQRYGRGVVLTVALDVQSAARQARGLVLDVIERALRSAGTSLPILVDGTTIDVDLSSSRSDRGTTAAIVNHGDTPLDVVVRPGERDAPGLSTWRDLVSQQQLGSVPGAAGLPLRIPASGFRAVELVTKGQ